MKFDPAFVALERRLTLSSPEEQKEGVGNLVLKKSPERFAEIAAEVPDGLLFKMMSHFGEEIGRLLEEGNGCFTHLTRGRIFAALSQVIARRINSQDVDAMKQQQAEIKQFKAYANAALAEFRQARSEDFVDSRYYAALILEMKNKPDAALRELQGIVRTLGKKTPNGIFNEIGRYYKDREKTHQEKLGTLSSKIEYFMKADPSIPEEYDSLIKLYTNYKEHVSDKVGYKHADRKAFLIARNALEKCIYDTEQTLSKNGNIPELLQSFRDWYKLYKKNQQQSNLYHALRYYKKSLEGDNPFLPALFNVAGVYEFMGRRKRAGKTYKDAMKRGIVVAKYFYAHWLLDQQPEGEKSLKEAKNLIQEYIRSCEQQPDESGNINLQLAKDFLQNLEEELS